MPRQVGSHLDGTIPVSFIPADSTHMPTKWAQPRCEADRPPAMPPLLRGWPDLEAVTHLVVRLDGAEPHGELEAQEVVGAHGLQLQQLAQRHQLRPREVVQGQLVLKQFGETNDFLIAGSLPSLSDLQEQR